MNVGAMGQLDEEGTKARRHGGTRARREEGGKTFVADSQLIWQMLAIRVIGDRESRRWAVRNTEPKAAGIGSLPPFVPPCLRGSVPSSPLANSSIGVNLPRVGQFLRLRNASNGNPCYREVAVRSVNSFRVLAGGSLVIGALFALSGCSDVLTYSKESRDAGMELYNQGDYTDAGGDFKNAVRQNPADYRSHYYLADCYAKQQAYNQAIQQYQTCLLIMPTTLEGTENRPFRLKAIDGLAAALAATRDPQAETDAVSQGQTPQEKYFLLAKVERNLGDADAAVQAYHQAALLDPKDFDIAKEYSLYLMKLKDVQAADPELRRAYALNDKDDDINSALREIGVVPGPGLKPESDLAKPFLPEGPIPMVDMSKVHLQNPFRTDSDTATSSADVSQSPRD